MRGMHFFIHVAVAMSAPAAGAQVFSLTWTTLDPAGTLAASGGSFEISATAGQVDGVSPSFATPWNLRPGFWGGDPVCLADRNGDAVVDLLDFFSFFGCWDASSLCADIDGSGLVDLSDFFAFFNAWDQFC